MLTSRIPLVPARAVVRPWSRAFDVHPDGENDERLTRLGCRFAQGWLYGRPMPVAELTVWLGTQHVDVAHPVAG